jgi:hypothetical protein
VNLGTAQNKEVDQVKKFLLTLIVLGTQLAYAYEFKLQFTPPGGAQGLVVAGYKYVGSTVEGTCSYYTQTSGTNGKTTKNIYSYTCTWDMYGNLKTIVWGAPTAPTPVSQTGTEIVYALNGTSKAGQDTRGFGFVNTPSSHYTWLTPSGGSYTIPYSPLTLTLHLVSDGDWALDYHSAWPEPLVQGIVTPSAGTAKIDSSTCTKAVAVGSSCTVTVTYNPTAIACTPDPYGFAYTKLAVGLATDAGAGADFFDKFTVKGVPACN